MSQPVIFAVPTVRPPPRPTPLPDLSETGRQRSWDIQPPSAQPIICCVASSKALSLSEPQL